MTKSQRAFSIWFHLYNITNENASDQLQKKLNMHEGKHSERIAANNDMYVPENPPKKCTGFSYIGPKLYNIIPKNIKEAKTTDDFKTKLKAVMGMEEHPLIHGGLYRDLHD